jgi:hypothetical protein
MSTKGAHLLCEASIASMLPFCLGDATILNEVCICVNHKFAQVIISLL